MPIVGMAHALVSEKLNGNAGGLIQHLRGLITVPCLYNKVGDVPFVADFLKRFHHQLFWLTTITQQEKFVACFVPPATTTWPEEISGLKGFMMQGDLSDNVRGASNSLQKGFFARIVPNSYFPCGIKGFGYCKKGSV